MHLLIRSRRSFPAGPNIVKSNQIDIVPLAVLRNLEQIQYSQEARFPRQFRSNVREPDRYFRFDFDLPVSHAIATALRDARAHPNPDAASDIAANHPLAKALGKQHRLLLSARYVISGLNCSGENHG